MKVVLAGAGAFGKKHLDGIKNIDDVECVSVVGRRMDPTLEIAEQYFAEDLRSVQRLQDDGLAEYRHGVVRASEPGRPLLRLLAMWFDPYLRAAHEQPRYSRAI